MDSLRAFGVFALPCRSACEDRSPQLVTHHAFRTISLRSLDSPAAPTRRSAVPAPAPGPVRLPENPGPAPVFVDDTGRRHRFVRGFGWILAAVITVYLALLTVSLVGSPGLVPLSLPAVGRVLPGPAAPLLSDGSRAGRTAGELVPTAATPAARVPAG